MFAFSTNNMKYSFTAYSHDNHSDCYTDCEVETDCPVDVWGNCSDSGEGGSGTDE